MVSTNKMALACHLNPRLKDYHVYQGFIRAKLHFNFDLRLELIFATTRDALKILTLGVVKSDLPNLSHFSLQ